MIIIIILHIIFDLIIYFKKISVSVQNSQYEKDLTEINNIIISLKNNNGELYNNMSEINITLVSLKNNNGELNNNMNKINNTLIRLKNNNGELYNNMSDINNTLIRLKNNNGELYNNMSDINNTLISLKNDNGELYNNMSEINNTLIRLKNNNGELYNNMSDINNILISLKNNNDELYNNMSEINNTLISLKNDNEKNKEKIEEINSLKVQIIKTNLTSNYTFKKNITKLKQFKSGNIISILKNNSILITDNNFNDIQILENSYEEKINDIVIFDDNNFVSYSNYSIKTYIKNNDTFEENVKKDTNNQIIQVIFNSKGNLISLSKNTSYIIIWEYKNKKYENIKTLKINTTNLIYLLEDKNILISVSNTEIIFWDISSDYEKIKTLDISIITSYNNIIERISEDRIIIVDYFSGMVISISEMEIIEEIKTLNLINNYQLIENKGLMLTTYDNYLNVYRMDNFDKIQTIEAYDNDEIKGLLYLNNGTIVISNGKEVKFLSF
jgi:K+/H+ antiporter YhaU regulatory subunit KhtT